MKMVIAYVDRDAVGPIEVDLGDLDVKSLGVVEANCPSPGTDRLLHYRGTTVALRMTHKVKLECIVAAHHVTAVVDSVIKHDRGHLRGKETVFVTPVEQTYAATQPPAEASLVALG